MLQKLNYIHMIYSRPLQQLFLLFEDRTKVQKVSSKVKLIDYTERMNYPLKRFIREGCTSSLTAEQSNRLSGARKIILKRTSGEETEQFYKTLVGTEESYAVRHIKTKRLNHNEENIKSCELKTFNINEFYRCAIENKAEYLRRFNYGQDDINVQDSYGWTALMMAACAGALESVNVLLSLGANANIKDKSGKTAKDLSEKKGYFHIGKILNDKNGQSKHNGNNTNTATVFKAFAKPERYYCNICENYFQETPRNKHQTSTIHKFNSKNVTISKEKLQRFNIFSRNKGLQLMVKQGWDKESGLGPTQNGRLYPIRTTIRKPLSGLGIEQQPARVTHFFSKYYKHFEMCKQM